MARPRRNPSPLDAIRLEEMALNYVARFATSRGKLEAYLARKVRERGWEGEDEPAILALCERFEGSGYIDDEAYARAKAGSLLRRGYGSRRIGAALTVAGIDENVRERIRPDEGECRAAALRMARKRRFGPFGEAAGDPARREKQIAAMLRAGHAMDHVLALVGARSEQEAEDWADAARDDD